MCNASNGNLAFTSPFTSWLKVFWIAIYGNVDYSSLFRIVQWWTAEQALLQQVPLPFPWVCSLTPAEYLWCIYCPYTDHVTDNKCLCSANISSQCLCVLVTGHGCMTFQPVTCTSSELLLLWFPQAQLPLVHVRGDLLLCNRWQTSAQACICC